MNYFTNEHEMFRESLRDFLKKEVKGNIEKWESDQKIPKEIWKKMGDQGFLGLCYPDRKQNILAAENLGGYLASLHTARLYHNLLRDWVIMRFYH